MAKDNALQRIDSHEKLCRIMQKQTHDKMNDLQGKKRKRDEAGVREQSRISCGADIVIEHMLPYLLPATQKK